MNEQGTQTKKSIRTVREVIDEEFMTIGDDYGKIYTREELEDYHHVVDLLDEKLALGCTVEQINAEWKGKSDKEIIAEAEAKKSVPRRSRKRTTPQAILNKTL